MFTEQYKMVDLHKLSGGEDLELIEEFCDFYDWLPIDTGTGFNILDKQLNIFVEDEDYKTFSELVNRIVGRAIDYFRDENEWQDEEDLSYGYGLYNIAIRHKDGTEWEEDWLADFYNELESFKKELRQSSNKETCYKDSINYVRKDFTAMQVDTCKFCWELTNECGEKEQLETAMTCLSGLMDWCRVCINNNNEEQDYNKLKQAYDILEEVHKSYEVNYD